jgi:dihydroorotate dehydrogenase
MDGEQAQQKLDAGASLVQAYTGFIYGGPRWPRRVLRTLRPSSNALAAPAA